VRHIVNRPKFLVSTFTMTVCVVWWGFNPEVLESLSCTLPTERPQLISCVIYNRLYHNRSHKNIKTITQMRILSPLVLTGQRIIVETQGTVENANANIKNTAPKYGFCLFTFNDIQGDWIKKCSHKPLLPTGQCFSFKQEVESSNPNTDTQWWCILLKFRFCIKSLKMLFS